MSHRPASTDPKRKEALAHMVADEQITKAEAERHADKSAGTAAREAKAADKTKSDDA